LDPKLYLSSLGVPVAPTNLNQHKQDALRTARTGATVATPVPNNPPAFN
jgi:hypothetical protein